MMWVLLNSAALRESCCGRAEGAGVEKTSRARSQVEKDPDHDPIGLLSQYIMVSPVFCFFPLVLFLHLRVSLGEV